MGETESQAPDGAKATHPPQARSSREGGVPGGRRLPFALLVVFTALCAWWTHGRVDAQDAWTTDALLLPEDRLPDEIVYLRLAHDGVQEDEDLRAASLTLDRERPGLRVPIAAPPGEIGAWLDAHALYLLPVESHEALAARFEDEAMTRAVQELRAHLNSPFFGLMDEQARRDPLGVRPLLAPFLGSSERGFASQARVTSTGDLLSADSSALLIELRSSASAWELERELQGVLADALAGSEGGPPIELRVIDPREPDPPPRPYEPYLPLVAIAFVAFAVERRLLAPLLRLGVAALAVGVASGFAPAQAPFEFPLYCALLGTAYWLAGPRTIDSYAPVIFGVALAPLVASVYPGWAPWASAWLLGCLAAVGGGFALRKRLEPKPG